MAVILEDKILDHLRHAGPLTGLELKHAIAADSLTLWQTCRRSPRFAAASIGTRYLRLDQRVEGFARLSPSILRAFLSYTVVGLTDQADALARKAYDVAAQIEMVSRKKRRLAETIVANVRKQVGGLGDDALPIGFILAGDIVYNMAHDVPRPERSTGELVKGSDIDLVVVLADDAPDDLLTSLDEAIYSEKYRVLTSPALREEIDYVVKPLSRVREQLRFDTFTRMIACKILDEGVLLSGSASLFQEIKTLLNTSGATAKLRELEQKAETFGHAAEAYLLQADPETAQPEHLNLFYPSEESEEFE